MLLLPHFGGLFGVLVLYILLELVSPARFQPSLRLICWSLLTAAVVSLPLLLVVWNAQEQISRKRGENIVEQLEAYHQQQGRYPDSLAQLVPRYLPKLPSTAQSLTGWRRYDYYLLPDLQNMKSQQHDAYWLSYYTGMWTTANYSSLDRRWRYTD